MFGKDVVYLEIYINPSFPLTCQHPRVQPVLAQAMRMRSHLPLNTVVLFVPQQEVSVCVCVCVV